MKEFIEELKKFMAEDDEDIEGALEKEDIEKAEKVPDAAMKAIKGALNILNKYKADMPDDVLTAIKTLAKYAAYGYPAKKEDLEKAGAKLSKTTRDQLAKILAFLKESPKAINMLKTLLGQEVEKDEGGDDDEKLSPETLAKLEKLAGLEETEKERIEKEEKEEAEKKKKDAEDVLERLEALEKKKGIKKSIDDPNEGDKKKVKKGADDEDQWPSVYVPGIPESED